MVHVQVTSEPYEALAAPITEFAVFTVKPGESKEKVEEFVDAIAKTLAAMGPSAGVFGPSWGPIVEHDNKLGLFIGWSSVEVCTVDFPA